MYPVRKYKEEELGSYDELDEWDEARGGKARRRARKAAQIAKRAIRKAKKTGRPSDKAMAVSVSKRAKGIIMRAKKAGRKPTGQPVIKVDGVQVWPKGRRTPGRGIARPHRTPGKMSPEQKRLARLRALSLRRRRK